MRLLLLALLTVVFAGCCTSCQHDRYVQREKLFENGLSPDKALGIYLISHDWDKYPSLEVRREREREVIGKISCTDYIDDFDWAYSDWKVAWSLDSRYFAFVSRGTKESRAVDIYSCDSTNITLLEIPDLMQAVSQREPSAIEGRYFFLESASWRGQDLSIQILGSKNGDASNPEDQPDNWYVATVVIHVESPKQVLIRSVSIDKVEAEQK